MKKILIFAIIIVANTCLNAQNQIEGRVLELTNEGTKKPLIGANVFWEETNQGSITDENGVFFVDQPISFPATLTASYVGYTFHSKEVIDNKYIFYFKSIIELNEVSVKGNVNSTSYSLINPVNLQNLSTKELQKAACCNLSEVFETNSSVDVVFSDAISGMKKIHMLGLDGSYIQITSENMPLFRGIQKSFGLSHIPGSWIESIQIIKGTGSVVNGFESFTGQINLEYFKPSNADKIFWNFYSNSDGKLENNLLFSKKNGKWKSNLFTHISFFDREIDRNSNNTFGTVGDGYLDIPKIKHFSILNRWAYTGSDIYRFQINVRGMLEERLSGQKKNVINPYVADIDNGLINIYSKIGTVNSEGKSIALQSSLLIHKQNAKFGSNFYNVLQESSFINLIYENRFNDIHNFRFGFSNFADRFSDIFKGNISKKYDHLRTNLITGVYTEHTYRSSETFNIVAGLRFDYYNNTDNIYYSPRTNLRYNPTENTVFRLSVGKTFRIPQPILKNLNHLNSSRFITIENNISPEQAVNYGINATYCFYLFNKEGIINLDIYRIQFQNRVIADIENQDILSFYNLEGNSYSNSFQIDINYDLLSSLKIRLGYKLNNSIATFNGVKKSVPLLPYYKAVFNVEYINNSKNWLFDVTTNFKGSSRIPKHKKIDFNYSDSFSLVNFNITRKFDEFDLYFGGENIFNFTQENPIIGGEDWSTDFEASLIYAPVRGSMLYFGLRYSIN